MPNRWPQIQVFGFGEIGQQWGDSRWNYQHVTRNDGSQIDECNRPAFRSVKNRIRWYYKLSELSTAIIIWIRDTHPTGNDNSTRATTDRWKSPCSQNQYNRSQQRSNQVGHTICSLSNKCNNINNYVWCYISVLFLWPWRMSSFLFSHKVIPSPDCRSRWWYSFVIRDSLNGHTTHDIMMRNRWEMPTCGARTTEFVRTCDSDKSGNNTVAKWWDDYFFKKLETSGSFDFCPAELPSSNFMDTVTLFFLFPFHCVLMRHHKRFILYLVTCGATSIHTTLLQTSRNRETAGTWTQQKAAADTRFWEIDGSK